MTGRLVDTLFKRRVLWVTGKGGTGKSTIAAALSLLAAESGLRTLLIDVEARGDAAQFLDCGPPRYQAKEARPNLFHLALHPEEVLDEYLRVAMKMPRVRRIGPVRRVFDFVATAAPGIKEVLIAGKIGFEERARNGRPRWDLIVVDAAAAGQVLSHLRGPRSIQEIVQVGMIRNQTAWVQEIIEDPEKTGLVIVALAEEMPVAETSELIEQLPSAVGTPVLGIVATA
jgi:anion-transporting  ArsA/GET3 family ATPase